MPFVVISQALSREALLKKTAQASFWAKRPVGGGEGEEDDDEGEESEEGEDADEEEDE